MATEWVVVYLIGIHYSHSILKLCLKKDNSIFEYNLVLIVKFFSEVSIVKKHRYNSM